MEANEPELALKAYYRAAAETGIDADVLSAIGSANLALGRLGQAEQVLRRALERDPGFVPALNNLGCVLMEQGKIPEARNVFQQAFALDSGASDSIRENLRLAIARMENPVYSDPEEVQEQEAPNLKLVRRGHGEYVLLSAL
ncbi:MAG: tetratricopeptide repeat protein [Gemmobacter sp.]|nr:tetratricopeptide repeat protein [Gemmobacter sp.]